MNVYKQVDIAHWLGLSEAYLSQLFNDQRKLRWATAERVARIMGVKPEKVITQRGPALRELCFNRFKAKDRKRLQKLRGKKNAA